MSDYTLYLGVHTGARSCTVCGLLQDGSDDLRYYYAVGAFPAICMSDLVDKVCKDIPSIEEGLIILAENAFIPRLREQNRSRDFITVNNCERLPELMNAIETLTTMARIDDARRGMKVSIECNVVDSYYITM